MNKRALITGISGQDGSYLAELLLSKGYFVHGIIRRHSQVENQTSRIDHIRDKINLEYGDLTDLTSLIRILKEYQFDEIYNLGAMSNVGISFKMPVYTQDANYIGFINLLEAIKLTQLPTIKIYQASSSEMFGNQIDADGFQRETTPMIPVSPYGVSKLSAHLYAGHVRRSEDLYISCGVLFNHESYRRGINFVTGKICKAVADIVKGKQNKLVLGNLDAKRDWGHSKDYVRVMWSMLQQDVADDYILCTGKTTSVREFCDIAFKSQGLNYKNWVTTDKKYLRSEELFYLRGCNDKIRENIGFELEYSLEDMILEMINWHKKKK
tara:strand:+ start:10414 stop:11385 length:972 start_codon:yes stop_codon:yes gene_type:complete